MFSSINAIRWKMIFFNGLCVFVFLRVIMCTRFCVRALLCACVCLLVSDLYFYVANMINHKKICLKTCFYLRYCVPWEAIIWSLLTLTLTPGIIIASQPLPPLTPWEFLRFTAVCRNATSRCTVPGLNIKLKN